MTCHEFQRQWNELLDAESGVARGDEAAGSAPIGLARTPAVDEAESLLLGHAADCPACRPIAARYQVLRQAIRAWRQPPVPSADLMQRILSTPAEAMPRTWGPAPGHWRRLWTAQRPLLIELVGCSAAILLCMVLLTAIQRGLRTDRAETVIPPALADLHSHAIPPRAPATSLALNRALAEATSATWDLARSASEPAARISRDVLDASESVGESPAPRTGDRSAMAAVDSSDGLAGLSLPMPSLGPLTSDPTAASAVFQQVGDQLAAGVAPISNTARHAFGFLLGAPRPRAGSRDSRSTPTGA